MESERRETSRDPLGVAGHRFDRWRADGSPGRRIPEALWRAAVAAARVHGVSKTALALHLNHTVLQGRAASTPGGRSSGPGPGAVEFLQIPPVALPAAPECVVEVQDPSGARLRLELSGQATSALEGALRVLWETR